MDTAFLKGEKAGSHKAELRLRCKFDKASANPAKHQSNDFPLEKLNVKQKSPDPSFSTNSLPKAIQEEHGLSSCRDGA